MVVQPCVCCRPVLNFGRCSAGRAVYESWRVGHGRRLNEHRRVSQFAIRGDWIPASPARGRGQAQPEKSAGSGFSRSPKGLEQGRSKQLRRFAPVFKTLDSGCRRSGGGGASGDSKAASARRPICHPWHLDACLLSAHFLNSVFHKPQIQRDGLI